MYYTLKDVDNIKLLYTRNIPFLCNHSKVITHQGKKNASIKASYS